MDIINNGREFGRKKIPHRLFSRWGIALLSVPVGFYFPRINMAERGVNSNSAPVGHDFTGERRNLRRSNALDGNVRRRPVAVLALRRASNLCIVLRCTVCAVDGYGLSKVASDGLQYHDEARRDHDCVRTVIAGKFLYSKVCG